MPILKPNLSKELELHIAEDCHRILKALEQWDISIVHSLGLCANSTGCSFYHIFTSSYPFNTGKEDYIRESKSRSIFKNKKRMAFLRRWAKKHKK